MSSEEQSTPPGPPPPPAPLLPYAPAFPQPQAGEIFQDGELLIAPTGVTLPPRCILCGDDAGRKPIRLSFSWDPSFTLTRRSTLQMRQEGHVLAYLCRAHRTRWSHGRLFGIGGTAASAVAMIAGVVVAIISESSDVPERTGQGMALMVAGFAALILSLFFFTLRTRTLSCARIHEGYLYLADASPAFLHHLPAVPAPPTPAAPPATS